MKHYLIVLLCVLSVFFTSKIYASDSTNDDSYNPLLDEKFYDDIDFSKITEENYVSAIVQIRKQTFEEYKKIADNEEEASFENTVLAISKASQAKVRLQTVISFLMSFHSTFLDSTKLEELLKKYQTSEEDSKVEQEEEEIGLKLIKRINEVYKKKDLLNEEDQKLLESIHSSMCNPEQINLSRDEITELNKIDSELDSLKDEFAANLLKSDAGDRIFIQKNDKDIDNKLEGIPESSLASFENEARDQNIKEQGYLITYQNPKTQDILMYAKDRTLRQQVYEMLVNHGKELNSKVVIDIMNLRLKKAKLLGFKNYAEYAFQTSSMVKTPQNAMNFLNKLKESTLEKSKQKYEELLKFARDKEHDSNFELQAWDFIYYIVQQQEGDKLLELLKPYFELSHVRDGVFTVLNRLYGVSFTKKEDVSLYYKNNKDGIESVEAFEVTDKDGSYLGRLYLDYFTRQGKKEGGFAAIIKSKELKSDDKYTPTTMSVCLNFSSQPTDGKILLSTSDVISLFHEMGHAMNLFFMKPKYLFLSSPDIDIGELPSQILEKWAFSKEVLSLYAKHYKTGEDIPESLIEMINKKKKKDKTLTMSTKVFLFLMDLDWNLREEYFPTEGISNEKYIELENDFEEKEWGKYGYASKCMLYVRTYNLSHMIDVGYESRLYNYLWSEMLVEQAFEKFKEKGDIFDKDVAESFRENILSIGSNKDPLKAYQKFIGTTDLNIKPLLKEYGISE